MNLQIRDPRARILAKELAEKRQTSMTEAVIGALEAQLVQERRRRPLAERLDAIARDLAMGVGPRGKDMTKDEIDAMWGHD